jgi:hypothetical protein
VNEIVINKKNISVVTDGAFIEIVEKFNVIHIFYFVKKKKKTRVMKPFWITLIQMEALQNTKPQNNLIAYCTTPPGASFVLTI